METLRTHFNKNQSYLKLGDNETFQGAYVSWEAMNINFKGTIKKGYRFTLEREDGTRISWDTSNSQAILQFADLMDQGLKKGDPIKIVREGVDKTNTRYTITKELPF